MKRLLREPLLHFLLIGVALFALNSYVSSDDPDGLSMETGGPAQEIVIRAGRIEQLATIFTKTRQRPPTDNELRRLVDEFLLEEVYYRQALAIGLDRDDTMIRRWMRQKLEFLTDDTTASLKPSDLELQEYLGAHADRFRESPLYTFRQVYFNPEKHADRTQAYVAEQLEQFRSGDTRGGDTSLLQESFQDASQQMVDATFGNGFAAQLDELIAGKWGGPVESGLGLHLVHLEKRTPGRLPDIGEIRELVERDWLNEQRINNRKEMNDRLREKYEVIIEWPEGHAPPKARLD